MSLVIGIDVGTQSSKGVLVEAGRGVLASASAPHRVSFPAPNWAQQDPGDWIGAVTSVIGSLVGEAGSAASGISHVAVDAQVDGVVAVDAGLQPLHEAIIWMDRRAVEHTKRIEGAVGVDRLFEITGLNCDSSHSAPKMAWLLERSQPRWLLPPASMITSWLTGEVAQDHANASSSMLWDVTKREWSDALLQAAKIDPKFLPPVSEALDVLGTVRPELADQLGLPAGCQVLVGTGDDHAAAVGAGAVRAGVVADVTGTAEPIGGPADRPVFDTIDRLVETHAHAVPGMWFIENPGFVSGGSVLWCADLLGISQAEVFALAETAQPGSKGLVFVPALSGSMAPRWIDLARGSFTGASMDHGRPEWCRAVLEGCAFALRDVVDRMAEMGLSTGDVRVTGGGARSQVWMRIKADTLGRPMRPVLGEGTATGAACLAAVAADWYPDLVAATDDLVELGEPVEPAPSEDLQDAYRRYRRVFDALEPTYS
ncbi:MAG TPA: FGGY family carbohydrate kinase [Acidimicrobiia bacterium]|nr:FGGY family carbohydrate kinase [Acidimicrobiia bacterium]